MPPHLQDLIRRPATRTSAGKGVLSTRTLQRLLILEGDETQKLQPSKLTLADSFFVT